jgi:large subunit ribosomal protein L4
MKAAALRGALSDRARNSRIHVVGGRGRPVQAVDQGRQVALLEQDLVRAGTSLSWLSDSADDALTWLSAAERAERAHPGAVDQLNTYDVLRL